jgi:Uma2 family endonuclease
MEKTHTGDDMTALPIDTVQQIPEGWTVADVDALPENGVRYELVDGVPRAMAPPKIKHQWAAQQFCIALQASLPDYMVAVQGIGVVLADDQRPIPDVVVVSDIDGELNNVPADQVVLVAEIVSRSSRSDDRFRKPALYAEAGIPLYVRVELDGDPHVVVYALEDDGAVYTEVGRAHPGQRIELSKPLVFTLDPAVLLR